MLFRSYFYDRETKQPVESASELYQIGNFLLAKDVKYAPTEQFMYEETGREVSPLGFYSALSDQIARLNIKATTPEGWKQAMKGLLNKGLVKQEEIEWTGLNDWLDLQQGKVTKEQVMDYLREGGVRVEETQLDGKAPVEYSKEYDRITQLRDRGGQISHDEWQRRIAALNSRYGYPQDADPYSVMRPRYSQYVLPGGTNYREVLLTLPPKKLTVEEARKVLGAKPDAKLSDADIAYAERKATEEYRSPHWNQPNVLAHIRMNDRTDADGKRVLFIEEIQSDWGQEKAKGRKEEIKKLVQLGLSEAEAEKRVPKNFGFASNLTELPQGYQIVPEGTAYKVITPDGGRIGFVFETKEEAVKSALRYINKGVPTAPFVGKTEGWLNLALKRIIKIGRAHV